MAELMPGRRGAAPVAGQKPKTPSPASTRRPRPAEKPAAAAKPVLVIVESPAKARTIGGYLGKDYCVLASMGHLIDLPKSRIGIDLDGGFEPEYRTIRGKAALLKEIHKAARKSRLVLLASDNDREGEAISFQIQKALRLKAPELPMGRIVFNEITPQAIREAVNHPRPIDETRVRAQKARRVLDRLVGYNLSPLLWKKVKSGLSAGRVQSVALRLICDREEAVEAFLPEEYWGLEAVFRKGRTAFTAGLVGWAGEGPRLADETRALALVSALGQAPSFTVLDLSESEALVEPEPPLTTSTLQQAAARLFGFTSKKTMQLAQQLYEGVDLEGGRIGLITYMRTDSTRCSVGAIEELRGWLARAFPAELPETPRLPAQPGRAQDAHEAIRPTMVDRLPEGLSEVLTKDQAKLYALIWERFVASQMTAAKKRSTTVELTAETSAGPALFRAGATRLVERGFYKIVRLSATKDEKREGSLPELRPGEVLRARALRPEQRFTRGPARYTDASIIKALDEEGIGRPSTYAPIISLLLERFYVTREGGELRPSALGTMISGILVESFPDLIDAGFTARIEAQLDEVEEEGADWVEMIRGFYGPFKRRVDKVMEGLKSYKGLLDEATDRVCEKCGLPMVKRIGRNGFFLACTGFPACKTTASLPLAACPRCGTGELVARRRAAGRSREFYGCSRYPVCDFVSFYKPTSSSCPKCGHFLVERFDKKRGSYKACINPLCDHLHGREGEA